MLDGRIIGSSPRKLRGTTARADFLHACSRKVAQDAGNRLFGGGGPKTVCTATKLSSTHIYSYCLHCPSQTLGNREGHTCSREAGRLGPALRGGARRGLSEKETAVTKLSLILHRRLRRGAATARRPTVGRASREPPAGGGEVAGAGVGTGGEILRRSSRTRGR